jgi:hypothetical protein
VLAVPGLHEMRIFSLRDQTYRPEQIQRADGGFVGANLIGGASKGGR